MGKALRDRFGGLSKAVWGSLGLMMLQATYSLMAGSIDWAEPAADVSDSLQSAAHEMIPFVVSGGALAAGFYLQNLMPAVIGMTGSCFLAANSDQAQTVFAGGGGGGLLDNTVYVLGANPTWIEVLRGMVGL